MIGFSHVSKANGSFCIGDFSNFVVYINLFICMLVFFYMTPGKCP